MYPIQKSGPMLNGMLRVIDRGGKVASLERNLRRQGVPHGLQWVEVSCAAHGCRCVSVSTGLRQGVSERSKRRRVARIEIDGPSEGRFCRRPLPAD